jgi:type I thyroxine 5'-deiodinase
VYIMEAHASDVWQMPSNVKQNIIVASPRNAEERTAVADSCVRNLHIEIPALVDNFRNSTEAAYTGWPDRLYVIGADGRVAYKSGPGPFGFHPQEVAGTLRKLLGEPRHGVAAHPALQSDCLPHVQPGQSAFQLAPVLFAARHAFQMAPELRIPARAVGHGGGGGVGAE